MTWMRVAACLGALVLVGSVTVSRAADDPVYQQVVVAADHPAASAAGVEVYLQGGNVVDAAVATGFSLSVVRPASSGIGGGGFLVLWLADPQQAITLDYREMAPAKARREMYTDPEKPGQPIDDKSEHGPFAVAIPGHVAGLCLAHQKFGRLPLEVVLAPAVRLAREGVPADEHDVEIQQGLIRKFQTQPALQERFADFWRIYLESGRVRKVGDRVHSPQARVIEMISRKGPQAFYSGEVAEKLVQVAGAGGEWLTTADLAGYRPKFREPLRTTWHGYELVTMPPPSSGGVALLEALQILDAVEQTQPDWRLTRENRQQPESLHLLAEILRPAFADRAQYLADPDFAEVPVGRLTSPQYALDRALALRRDRTRPWKDYGQVQAARDSGTTHFSIIDANGNAAACTETVNTTYGSWVVEPEFGIVLNNEMDDFAAVPGQPNAFGLIQGEQNAVAAGKRPLSSMTPTILVRDGKAVFALGASGGPRIITATFQVLLNLSRYDLPPQEAINAPRLHHQWQPDRLELEGPLFEKASAALKGRGHEVRRISESAVVQAVSRQPDGLRGGSDPRKNGRPAGK